MAVQPRRPKALVVRKDFRHLVVAESPVGLELAMVEDLVASGLVREGWFALRVRVHVKRHVRSQV